MLSFRPLPGDLISQSKFFLAHTATGKAFPSPSRGSYFSIKVLFGAHGNWKSVSVPFPGILFLNQRSHFYSTLLSVLFPSPSRGSYFSISVVTFTQLFYQSCFRPLPGDLISQLYTGVRYLEI